ncbi:methyltransferase [Salix suchowensis]|nr:methyltransferase [Salix suchowensis]
MKYKDGKPVSHPDKNSRVPMAMMFVVLCGLSFYLGGIFCSEKDKIETTDVAEVVSSPRESSAAPLQIKSTAFPECSSDYQDYTPCTDPRRWKRYGNHRLTFMERHCPPVFERKECLVPPPEGYKPPITWPKSRDQCWYRNVPYDWIDKQKSNQHWLRKEGEKFLFPVAALYLIPEMKDGTIRSAIDTGCGWGGDLLDRGILTVSLAPRDNHEAQVQFALERGIPAILGIISTQRLPFPSNAFDMAHCSRCLIPWTEFEQNFVAFRWNLSSGSHRILRPGGFWVLSGPPVNYENRWRGWNTTVEEQKSDYEKLQELLTSMCFKLYDKKDDIAVWQKASENSCYSKLTIPMPTHRSATIASNQIQHVEDSCKALQEANVMDMNTVYGGFAAAVIDDPLWVMNVVSSYAANTLPVVFDRGLIGTFHDWCEAFSTYPRTYDLLHLDGLFTAESHRCDMKYVLLEMDRILRPAGYAIIRESSYFADAISTIARGMRWSCRREDTEYGAEKEKVLICQKKLWHSSNQSSR